MVYQTFTPQPDLEALVKCYWTLEIPANNNAVKQKIVPDGCLEIIFILGDDIKRYITDSDFIIQPRAMVLGQIIEPFDIQPVGNVNAFAIRFFPYGFANFIETPIKNLVNKETSLELLFGEKASRELEIKINEAKDTAKRIRIVEEFLLKKINNKKTIDTIVKSTIDTLLLTSGNSSIGNIVNNELAKRRQLERKFKNEIGISAKQLGKVIRMQAALKMLLNNETAKLTKVAYESAYYDQSHFIRDFKEFTGITPSELGNAENMVLSSLLYKNE